MAIMGKYCKTYPLNRLREFKGWTENEERAGNESTRTKDGEDAGRRSPNEEDYLFVQENYVVTDGIFLDENVVFNKVTPEWIDYCHSALGFTLPADGAQKVSPPEE
jgi:hypothetical protein